MGNWNHHGHEHSGQSRSTNTERALWVAFLLNLAFLVLEVVIGLWADSLALLSDAGHMVADVAALAFALVAERLSRTRPAGAYTFGLKRVPVLGAFGNALTLLLVAGLILWEAWQRLLHAPEVAPWPVLVMGVAGLFVNLLSAWWLHRSASESLNVRGAVVHLLADALGSVGAIVVAIVLVTTGWTPIDAIVSAFIAAMILFGTWPLLRDSTKVLLQTAPSRIEMDRLREVLKSSARVRRILDLHVWEIDEGLVVLTATLVTNTCALVDLEQATDVLRRELHDRFGIEHATFEWRTPEGRSDGCEEQRC